MPTELYKRATFVTHLPKTHLYTQSHNWLARVSEQPERWRVGYTKFALRMLGEIVDVQVERKEGEGIEPGDVLGSIEGFKAISDIFSVGSGCFVKSNGALSRDLAPLANDPYGEGWLYQFEGKPDARSLDLGGYRNLLDATIDRMLQKEQQSKAHE